MRRRLSLLPVLAALALLVAGCGGSSSTSGAGPAAGASIAPASAPVFATIDTDPASSQWKQVEALLDKFPGKDKLLAAIDKELAKEGVSYEQDIKPALGPEVDIALLGLAEGSRDLVGMVQPHDKAKLQALLDKLDQSDPSSPKTVTAEYKGWTLVADSQSAIDRFEAESAKGAIVDDATYKDALANEAADPLAIAYVNGAALQQLLEQLGSQLGSDAGCGQATQTASPVKLRYIGGALRAESDGVRLHATIQSTNAPSSGGGDTKALLSEIPSGTLAVLAFHGTDQFTQGFQQLEQACPGQIEKALEPVESLLGVKLKDVAALFTNETALYVRTGSPIPEVTFISHQDDAETALGTVDKIATSLGDLFVATPQDTTIDGTPAKELVLGGVSIYYAALDGKVVITDARSAITGLRDGSGDKLNDDPTFQDARKVSGMPEAPGFFLYLNLRDGIPYVESFARLAGESIPLDVEQNLQPLTSFVLYGSGSNEKLELTAFLQVR